VSPIFSRFKTYNF